MKNKKKWGWSKKNKYRHYRKMYLNSYSALYEIYDEDFVWDELRLMVFGDGGYKCRVPSIIKTLESRKFRFKCKKELRNNIKHDEHDNDTFPIPVKNILWSYC